MEFLYYIIVSILSMIVIQIGLTIRRNKIENSKKERLEIIEKGKIERINRMVELENKKIEAVANYEEKSSV